jgi:anti-sigma factor RsiW
VTAEPPPGAGSPAERAGDIDDDMHDDIDDAIIVAISDYLDGTLTGAARADVERKIAEDATWKRAHGELTETRNMLSGMRKAHARTGFAEDVAETIHRRSAGRFFGPRTLGDRVPFTALIAIAIAGLVVLAYVLWSSSTGSLKVDRERGAAPPPGSSAMPRP